MAACPPHPHLALHRALAWHNSRGRRSYSCCLQGEDSLPRRGLRPPGRSATPPPPTAGPGNPRGLAGKSQLCCWARFQAERASEREPAPRPALPAPPRPAASEPPRPWPGACPSFAAQMPRGSRRVGTCSGPGGGGGGLRHGCLSSSARRLPVRGFDSGLPGAAAPRLSPWPPPGAAGSSRAVVSRAPLRRKSAGRGAVTPPCPRDGALHSVRWAAGRTRAAARGGGHRRSPHWSPRRRGGSPRAEPWASPARPSPGPRAGARGCALRCAKAKAAPRAIGPGNFAAGGADTELSWAAAGDGERAGRVGSGARAQRFSGYK